MTPYLASRRVPQFVLQRFGEGFHAGLGDIIGGIAGRGGDALLRAGVDDETRASAFDHAWGKNMRTVNHPPEVDADHAPPVLQRSEYLPARPVISVFLNDIGTAEASPHTG